MKKYISDLTLRRFPKYMLFLRELQKEGREYTSASEISRALDVHHTQVRKDLALTGVRGVPKIGHRVDDLIDAIEKFLSWDNMTSAFLIGAGNLGVGLLNYSGFDRAGFQIIAAFDNNPEKIGQVHDKVEVLSTDKLPQMVEEMKVEVAIITTGADAAQEVADLLVKSGIKAIWNFTPVKLAVPESVITENVDIYPSLAVLLRKLAEQEKKR